MNPTIRSLLVACAVWAASSVANADLVSYWSFDGEDALDVVGPNHALPLGTTSFSPDFPAAIGSGFSMQTNANGDGALIAAPVGLSTSTFTLSMWVNNPGQTGVVNRLTGRAGYSFETAIQDATAFFGNGTPHALAFYDGTGWRLTTGVPTLGAWSHVAFVSESNTMRTYLNGALVDTRPTAVAPNGAMAIGAAIGGAGGTPTETMIGKFDDVAIWDNGFPAESIAMLASGAKTPITLPLPEPPEPPPTPTLTVLSGLDWTLSTVVGDGGPTGTWVPSGAAPPDVSTFTLVPTATSSTVIPHINAAAAALSATGLTGDLGVHYYRTTFNLDPYVAISANIQFAGDNGGEIWLNGEKLATETSYVVENWQLPLPSIAIAEDGGITTTKFDSAAATFESWLPGENELIIAVRNPSSGEPSPAGGFAFKMDVYATPIPEPSAIIMVALALAAIGGVRLARRKR
jgi:hypothetical protein